MADGAALTGIQFKCEHCGEAISVPAAKAGKEIGCPACLAALIVPEKPASASGGMRTVDARGSGLRRGVVDNAAKPAVVVAATGEAQEAAAPTPEAQREAPAPVMRSREAGARVAGEAEREARSGARRYKDATPKPKSKAPLLVVAAVVILGVAGFVGLTVSQNMARAKLQHEIEQQALAADAALKQGEIEEAARIAGKARQQLKLAEGLDAAKVTEWNKNFKKIDGYNERLKEVDELLKEAVKAPAKVKDQLQQKKALAEGEGAEAKPIVNKLVLALDEANRIERDQLLAGLRKELDAAEKVYLGGDVEAAMKQAVDLQNKIAANEKLKDKDLQTRLDLLRRHGDRYQAAKAMRASLQANFADVLKQFDQFAAKLDAAKPEDKPILAYVEKAKKEIQEEEKKFKRIDPKDLETLNRLAKQIESRDRGIQVGDSSPAYGVQLSYEGQNLNMALRRVGEQPRITMDAAGRSFEVDEKLLSARPGVVVRTINALAKAMQDATVPVGGSWRLIHEAPVPAARSETDGKARVFYAARLYEGEALKQELTEEQARADLKAASEALLQGVAGDAGLPEEVKNTVSVVLRGTFEKLAQNDYLTSEFCRRVVGDGYIEKNLPQLAEKLKPQLEKYREAYTKIVQPRKIFSGAAADGSLLEERSSFEAQVIFETYDKQKDATTYGIKHPSDEKPLFYALYEFAGKVDEFPKDPKPTAMHMVHPAVGVLASADAAGKLTFDAEKWALATALATPANLPRYIGAPQWSFPPHVALFNEYGDAQSIITPSGKLDFPHFSAVADLAQRRAAQDKFLDTMAKVLNSTGYLNLYYIYFHQYSLDSPVTAMRHLLGSSKHCGDIHQTVYESLDRELGARCMGDCDDLAELFHVVTKRQNKLSFVMMLPGHAACGWVDKDGDMYRMQFLQTGPPLLVEGNNLDQVVEEASRLHDHDKTMRFDPKSLGFLFRFAGEPTRTPYWLSTRMFVDPKYAEVMERVQGYWHFHFYALGIQTMEEMIAKGDRVPENCTELAGLYGQVREIKKSIQWTQEALKQLGPGDVLSRLNESMRIASMYRRDRDFENAYKTIQPGVAELKRLYNTQETMRYISSRMEYAAMLAACDKPWEAYELIERDAILFTRQHPKVPFAPGPALVGIYDKMKELISKQNYQPTAAENQLTGRIEQVLKWYVDNKLFMEDDDFADIMRKYATLARYYGAQQGRAKLVEELVKDGPFPEGERKHREDRRSPKIEEDWKWIRMSVLTHAVEFGDALDPEEPPEKWRKDDAIKLAASLERAAKASGKFGSLSSAENVLYTTRVVNAFLTKDWKALEEVLKVVKERNWARLTSDVSESFGASARFVTPQEFAQQYKMFIKYVDTKAPYFTVVYEAYRADGFEHAKLAAQLALEKWKDEDMKREAKYLDELIKARLAEKAAKDKPAPEKK